jgi:exosortase
MADTHYKRRRSKIMNTNEFSPANRDSRRFSESALRWGVVILALGYLWFRLIHNLWPEWTTNPQYGYGLLVPFLCLGLLVRRWQAVRTTGQRTKGLQDYKTTGPQDRRSVVRGPSSVVSGQRSVVRGPWSVVLLFGLLAFLYLPTRLIEASTPEWRPIQWLLGIEAIGLTLCAIDLGKGRGWLRQLAFPILFFFVAIPWPSPIETPIIQALTRMSASITIEVLGWLGVPALAHGNVIEVATGMVGIDEACSGIRSFQSSIMISLFFGEFYALNRSRRWLLVPAGFVFSMAFNVCRMTLLTLIAAQKGIPAISQYHDPAGFTIAIACTVALWGLALLLRSPKSRVPSPQSDLGPSTLRSSATAEDGPTSELRSPTSEASTLNPQPSTSKDQQSVVRVKPQSSHAASSGQESVVATLNPQPSTLNRLALGLIVWLVLVEAGVELWYRHLESQLKPGPSWSVVFPQDNPTLKDLPIDEKTRYLLRFDEGKQAAWTESDGTLWQVFYCSWLPGRVAGYLAKRHTPEICLQATGLKMVSGPELTMMNVHGVELPVRSYVFETAGGPINVFHCRWEAGADESAYVQHESARFNLVRGIWAGRGNKGQTVLEIIITGVDDPAQARAALIRQLDKLIKVGKPGANL